MDRVIFFQRIRLAKLEINTVYQTVLMRNDNSKAPGGWSLVIHSCLQTAFTIKLTLSQDVDTFEDLVGPYKSLLLLLMLSKRYI